MQSMHPYTIKQTYNIDLYYPMRNVNDMPQTKLNPEILDSKS